MKVVGKRRHGELWLKRHYGLLVVVAPLADEIMWTMGAFYFISPIQLATPGQAGTPAEFKHINKRRKRNLLGFP